MKTLLNCAAALLTALVLGSAVPLHAAESNEAGLKIADARRAAPEIVGITQWLNSKPLKIANLRGKVVLVDFWTYACYNCVNTLPYVTKLQEKYRSKGLVIIGVHTPEFPFERSTANVETAIKRYGITYPVAQDNDFLTWKAYNNRYWPAQYIVDKNGKIVLEHAGEGDYDAIESTIQRLLAEYPNS
jgi:thiol-disulfide isomerase/thioredoxin